MEVAPYRLSGNVYGVLLNQRGALAALGDAAVAAALQGAAAGAGALHQAAQHARRPRRSGGPARADAPELEVGATLGLVIGRTACRGQREREALDFVAGYTIVND